MIQGFNSSKKSYFIWLAVFLVLFVALAGVLLYLSSSSGEAPANIGEWLILFAAAHLVASFPIGFALRRRYLHWYAHIPTEDLKIQVSDVNLIPAIFSLVKCEFFTVLDLVLLAFYLVASAVIGVFFAPYLIVSGIIFIIKGRI